MSTGKQAVVGAVAGKRPDTKEKLKSAARSLFAAQGIEGVTVREILMAAGEKNGASLNYHFGRKEQLVKRIAVDIFDLLDKVWAENLEKLEAQGKPAAIRELVTVIVNSWQFLDEGAERTSLRLIYRLSRERQHLLTEIGTECGHQSFRRIMDRIAAQQPHIPRAVMAHRAIFLTRYLSVVMSMFEEAQNAREAEGQRLVGPVHDLGNVIDTAVGIVTAPVVDGGD